MHTMKTQQVKAEAPSLMSSRAENLQRSSKGFKMNVRRARGGQESEAIDETDQSRKVGEWSPATELSC